MDTPRDFSSPPSAILAHAVTRLDAGMERNPGLARPGASQQFAPHESTGASTRSSRDGIAHVVGRLVSLLGKHQQGLRAEQIRKELEIQPHDMHGVLKEALASKKITSKGKARGTTYLLTKAGR
jgi:hypothetical protein